MNNNFVKTNYVLQSLKTGNQFEDEGWTLEAPGETDPTLIRAVYKNQRIEVKDESLGLYKFADWLPVSRTLAGSSPPVTYKSIGLARHLGLSNLWITFSGWWPEKGAFMKTCSFKETEAYSVCGRMTPEWNKTLVVASAGNTARAFAKVCSENNIPLLLCVPEDNLDALWFDAPLNSCVKLICCHSGSDYFDAIHLSNIVAGNMDYVAEGGAKNVARRDGMATTVLSAVTTIGHIPDYYFQAVGSGTGAIAAWEANLRLLTDGRFGNNKMKLIVSQNEPFVPMSDAWKAKSRTLFPIDDELARKQAEKIDAKVLSNRKPPYSINGGLFDALTDSNGDVISVSNSEARYAGELFHNTEGNTIHPAAAVATASMLKVIMSGQIDKNATIMLNITGGGEALFKNSRELFFLKPNFIFEINPDAEFVLETLKSL